MGDHDHQHIHIRQEFIEIIILLINDGGLYKGIIDLKPGSQMFMHGFQELQSRAFPDIIHILFVGQSVQTNSG